MTRWSLAILPTVVLLGACDSPSSSESAPSPLPGVCLDHQGHWSKDTVYIQDAGGGLYDTIGIRTEMEMTATSYSLEWYGTYRRKTQLELRSLGSLRELDSSTLELIPSKVYKDDDETGEFGLSSDPMDYVPDTLLLSFPSPGRMRIVEKGSSGIVLACK